MIFLGNYADCIKQEWIDEILKSEGAAYPREHIPESPEMAAQWDTVEAIGYDRNAKYHSRHDDYNTSFSFRPPWIAENEKCDWWIVKMKPGEMFPMHVDSGAVYHKKDSKRYWMPLMDYEPGHIFMYEKEVYTDYKKGDVYQFENKNALHGAVNIGYTVRLALQATSFLPD
jgi:hypothetical protein